MKTVRTVTTTIVEDEELHEKPEFAVGDYMEVYNGEYEGHHFWIKDVRYNHDRRRFEYLYDAGLMGGWYDAGRLELLERKAALAQGQEGRS